MLGRLVPRLLWALLAVGAAAAPVVAQPLPPGTIDPAPVIAAATREIGADRFRCLTVSGRGFGGRVGQERYVRPEGDWPIDRLDNLTRTMNWSTGGMRETFDRAPGQTPASYKYGAGWIGGTPTQRHTRQMFAVRGGVGWHADGPGGEERPIDPLTAELWQLDLWLNPVGFLQAAAMPGADPIATSRWELGESGRDGPTTRPERVSVVSILVMGRYRVDATINARNLIQRIHTRFPHPVLGDMNVEHEFVDRAYQPVGEGMRFPVHWHSHHGYDDNFNTFTVASGHNVFDAMLPTMVANRCEDAVAVPAGLPPPASSARVDSERLADGVFLIGGATHNSVAIGFRDHVAVVEAPISEARSLAVIAEVERLFPGRPIRYLINTHQHFDSIGGLRTYAQLGATIITHQRNHAFYNRDVINYTPRQLQPDLLTLMPPTELTEGYTYELVRENHTLTDGRRTVRIAYAQPLAHADGMLMVYLEGERLLVQADMLNTHEPLSPDAISSNRTLYDMTTALGYDVDRIVPIHGRPIAWSEFVSRTNVDSPAPEAPSPYSAGP